MKFFSDIRLLILAIWLGAAVFFIGVAQSAFAVIEQRELAGAVVNRNLTILNFGGMAIAASLIVMSLVGSSKVSKFWLWVERFLLLIIGGGLRRRPVRDRYLAFVDSRDDRAPHRRGRS